MATIPDKSLEELIRELPQDLRRKVEDFVRLLLENQSKKPRGTFRFDWEGALEDLQLTSVELQHKLSEWRGD